MATSAQIRDNPLADMPSHLAERLRPTFDATAQEIIATVQSRVAEYARPGDPRYTEATRAAVRNALRAFIERIGDPNPPVDHLRETFRSLGAGEAREGRGLESLQTAMRTGAVVAWRRLSEIQAAEPEAFPRQHVARMAEAAFLFLEEIATAATEGHSQERAKVVDELQRRRGRLVHLLVSGDRPSFEAVATLAWAAGWRLPDTVSAVALRSRAPEAADTPPLPPDVLADFNRVDPCLVVPDPGGPGRLRTLEGALPGWDAAAGPAVSVTEVAVSLARAKETLDLMTSDYVGDTGGGVPRWDDHLVPLLLRGNETLLDAMARSRLAPLDRLRPAQRARMAETLLAWLQTGFNAARVAQRLHLHPQTVRYRLRRLEELFGDGLRDPDRRFELEMVLRQRRLLAGRSAPGQQHRAPRR